ncbi:hypothetical protein FJV76_24225 [Mesorhizobium sp. WSM4303]|uniref:hypothetical protein n=1 Tax=unclassified Mesorhizobium TaxID=325217 RepID=UPI00115DFBCC|nr:MULTISPECIES: hypothetical protein [unclassified Mesorhizobium]TRC92045.1 hypothetical protein FJV77_26955 [Mesorhizobium sp. WSM4306]TRC99314.1 hypothetical protein FJV76_24225 [Mesorhizobium sp. WSM4303]
MNRILIVVFCLLLAGCTSFAIGEPYDKAIDDELNAFQKSAAEFIKTMQVNAGTPKGSYESDGAKKYYAAAAASLSNLQLRADVLSSRTCPIAKALQLIASTGFDTGEIALAKAEGQVGGVADKSPPNVSGNCISITIRNIRIREDELEADHKDAGRLTPTVALIDGQEIDAAVRVALTALRAKNY